MDICRPILFSCMQFLLSSHTVHVDSSGGWSSRGREPARSRDWRRCWVLHAVHRRVNIDGEFWQFLLLMDVQLIWNR